MRENWRRGRESNPRIKVLQTLRWVCGINHIARADARRAKIGPREDS